MSGAWPALLLAAAGCYALKLAGVSLPDRVLGHPRVRRTAALLPVAMLAALVVVELVDDGGRYGADPAVLVGTAVAVVALLLRRGVLVVFLAAVAATALVRLLT